MGVGSSILHTSGATPRIPRYRSPCLPTASHTRQVTRPHDPFQHTRRYKDHLGYGYGTARSRPVSSRMLPVWLFPLISMRVLRPRATCSLLPSQWTPQAILLLPVLVLTQPAKFGSRCVIRRSNEDKPVRERWMFS